MANPRYSKIANRRGAMGGGMMRPGYKKGTPEKKMGGGMVDKKSKFMGGGIAYKGGGRAMKRKGGKV